MKNALQQLFQEASHAIMEVYEKNNFSIQHKVDSSPITQADRLAHDILSKGLQKILNIPVLSEESITPSYTERKVWEKFWLLDPLDGTKGFINKSGDFTINVALIENNVPTTSAVMPPVTKDFFYAELGKGAWKNSTKLKVTSEVTDQLSATASLFHGKPAEKKWYAHNQITQIDFRNSSIKICLIAENKFDFYRRFGPTTMEWDTAAAQLILEEAGGLFINLESNQSLTYNKTNLRNPPFIALRNNAVLKKLTF